MVFFNFFSHLIAYRSYTQTSSYSPSNLSSVFLSWVSHLHFILHERVPKFTYANDEYS
jgi:hypothetical protein